MKRDFMIIEVPFHIINNGLLRIVLSCGDDGT